MMMKKKGLLGKHKKSENPEPLLTLEPGGKST